MRALAIALPVLALSACEPVFQDTFEADPLNGAPLASPDGAPADALSFGAGDGAVFVTGALPLAGNQSLKIEGPSGATTPRVIMTSAPIFDQTKPVFLSWKGRLSTSAQVEIWVWVDFDKFPIRLNFEFGTVYVNGNSIGTFMQTGEHAVFVSLLPNDTYGVSLSGDVNAPEAASGPLPDADDFPGSHVGLSVNVINAENSSGYWMDDVRISHWKGQ